MLDKITWDKGSSAGKIKGLVRFSHTCNKATFDNKVTVDVNISPYSMDVSSPMLFMHWTAFGGTWRQGTAATNPQAVRGYPVRYSANTIRVYYTARNVFGDKPSGSSSLQAAFEGLIVFMPGR